MSSIGVDSSRVISTQETALIFPMVTPAQITANQNNYNPGTGTAFRLKAESSREITGWVSAVDGKILILTNVGTQNIKLKDNSTSSLEPNRFDLPGDFTITPSGGISLIYDTISLRWRAFSIK